VDTLLFLLILATFVALVRGLDRPRVLLLWTAALIGVLALFQHHATSSLDLNF
jgi:hypothetical protein